MLCHGQIRAARRDQNWFSAFGHWFVSRLQNQRKGIYSSLRQHSRHISAWIVFQTIFLYLANYRVSRVAHTWKSSRNWASMWKRRISWFFKVRSKASQWKALKNERRFSKKSAALDCWRTNIIASSTKCSKQKRKRNSRTRRSVASPPSAKRPKPRNKKPTDTRDWRKNM